MSMSILNNIQPYEVFKYFEEISKIPRGSGNEKNISDYLVNFARNHNLEVVQDNSLNVIIRKKSTTGFEDKPVVILQGHMDMVCEKNVDIIHDFINDPVKLKVMDDMIYATETTLGADNGIAVAMGLAILASEEIQHPSLELLFTTFEENGMRGADALDPKSLNGEILINLDSEEEGKLYVGCAGEITSKVKIPVVWEDAVSEFIPYLLKIKDLRGGHSGIDIHRGRANSNKLLSRILLKIDSLIDFRLVSLSGGFMHNAIPRESEALILIKNNDLFLVKNIVSALEKDFKYEFKLIEPNIKVEFNKLQTTLRKALPKTIQSNVINFLYLLPYGVNSMSIDIQGIVESSQNLGIINTNVDSVEYTYSIRSFSKYIKEELFNRLCLLAKMVGGEVTVELTYPEWSYNPNSKIKDICEKIYTEVYGCKPQITALHAGLECGLFSEKFNKMDMISFGPNVYDVHSPNEHISISSIQRTWKYLLEVLKNIK